jgi:hypothetical protein
MNERNFYVKNDKSWKMMNFIIECRKNGWKININSNTREREGVERKMILKCAVRDVISCQFQELLLAS